MIQTSFQLLALKHTVFHQQFFPFSEQPQAVPVISKSHPCFYLQEVSAEGKGLHRGENRFLLDILIPDCCSVPFIVVS